MEKQANLESHVKVHVPIAINKKASVNKQNQITIPKDLCNIYLEREQKEDITKCKLFYYLKEQGRAYIKETPKGEECSLYNPVKIGSDSRVTLKSFNSRKKSIDVMLIGHEHYLEIVSSELYDSIPKP
ncbi:hypothetical protein GF361_00945 [Candidatus Woesearchaeota archaeon]|nr:hypothetical protein [Candidatus Woesearchaeota archaeon]